LNTSLLYTVLTQHETQATSVQYTTHTNTQIQYMSIIHNEIAQTTTHMQRENSHYYNQ